jgi:hypothetical protein
MEQQLFLSLWQRGVGKPATNPNDHIQAVEYFLLLPEKLPDRSLDIVSSNRGARSLATYDYSQTRMAEVIGLRQCLKKVAAHRTSMLENGSKFIRGM